MISSATSQMSEATMPARRPNGLAAGREKKRGAASRDEWPGDVGGIRDDQDHGADGDPTFAARLVRGAPARASRRLTHSALSVVNQRFPLS